MCEIVHDIKRTNPFVEEKKNYPCVNFECEFFDKDDPDGFNCNLFYLPDGGSCENYMGGDE